MPAARPKTSARVLTSLENIKIMEEKERQKKKLLRREQQLRGESKQLRRRKKNWCRRELQPRRGKM